MPASKDELVRWLNEAGLTATHGNVPNADFSLDVKTPLQLSVTIWQRTDQPTALHVGAGIAILDEDRARVRVRRQELDWTIRSGLLLMGIAFNVVTPKADEAPSQVQTELILWDDRYGKSAVLEGVQRIINALVYVVVTVNRFKAMED